MKGQLFYKTILLLLCSYFVVPAFAQPTLPGPIPGEPLPLTLVSFSAAKQTGSSALYWKTANEVNVLHFVVEKSADGKNFASLGSVYASNKSYNEYSFTANNSTNSIEYYRLKMVDKDGSYNYSFVIILNGAALAKVSMYPSPAVSQVTVTHTKSTGKARIVITDVTGKTMQMVEVDKNVQQTSFLLNSSLKAGNYILQFSDESSSKSLFFSKQ